MRIKKGDKVMVISGDDKGVQGEVVRVLPSKDRIVVSGVNIVKKHQRPRQGGRSQVQGGIIEFEAPFIFPMLCLLILKATSQLVSMCAVTMRANVFAWPARAVQILIKSHL